ncbi:hypothetical protein [Bacillus pumilus]|nr:hypothetical protein [Bacillus pumilus]
MQKKVDELVPYAKLAEAEEEEKKGYETGITYDQLARTPEKYKGKK